MIDTSLANILLNPVYESDFVIEQANVTGFEDHHPLREGVTVSDPQKIVFKLSFGGEEFFRFEVDQQNLRAPIVTMTTVRGIPAQALLDRMVELANAGLAFERGMGR